MWSRRELKVRAKQVLRNIYWKAFLISLVILLVGGNVGSFNYRLSGNIRTGHSSNINMPYFSMPNLDNLMGLYAVLLAAIGFIIIFFAIRIFVGFALEVGGRRYFIQSAQYKDNKGCFKYSFITQRYIGILSTMLLRAIQNFLWYLLLLVPGIIKSYSYRMVPYILADNPNIGARKAIKLSNKMMDGHKFDLYGLDLSFIGWYILGILALLVGTLFVLPYSNATYAEFYLLLRRNALDNNYCSYEDLLLENPQTQEF